MANYILLYVSELWLLNEYRYVTIMIIVYIYVYMCPISLTTGPILMKHSQTYSEY